MKKTLLYYPTSSKWMLLTCLILTWFSTRVEAQGYDYPMLIQRIQENQRTLGIASNGAMDNWVAAQNADGSWSDLNYGNLTSSVSTSNNHLQRLWDLAAAVTKVGHDKYNTNGYKEAVKNGLQFWYGANTVDPNWWFNKIYFPQRMGEILFFMRHFEGYIPKVSTLGIDEPDILSLFNPLAINNITSHGTGANAIDVALHYVYRGILTEDARLLENTTQYLEQILAENIEADLVYHDHGPQIQISSYGWVFCNGLVQVASYLSGSPAEFHTQSNNFGKVLSFIRETQVSSIRGGSWDFSVMGRAISRKNGLNANLNYLQALADYIDPANAELYLKALARIKGNVPANSNVLEFNKHYWVSDYTQHTRSGYLFALRNTSTRTVEAESGNGENTKANFFSYGATFLSIDGDEYNNIMPLWDWAMIPGTTFAHTATFPARANWGVNFGKTSFVGGVSDGVYGAAVLDLDEAGTKGKKSWFFFEDEMVCLGAGISDNSNRNVRTTVNQCWMKTPSYICEGGTTTEIMQSVSSSTYQNDNLKYLRHGKFGYFFPKNSSLKYTMKSQSGNWKSININGSPDDESGYVFTLWMDHGSSPTNASYSYVVVPNIESKTAAQEYSLNSIEIVENSNALQAVYNNSLDILQVIFHQSGTLNHGTTSITVDRPCALMFRNGTLVTVSDPTQLNSVISVTINSNGTDYQKLMFLPNNQMQGASTTVDFKIEVPTAIDRMNSDLDMDFFPNPTRGLTRLRVNHENQLHYQVKDVKGKTIRSGQFVKEIIVDLADSPGGIYLITITDKYQRNTHKVIKY